MSLSEKVMTAIKDAMKAKDQNTLAALRAIKSELLLMQTSGETNSPEAEVKMLHKLVKQRKESAELYEKQNRMDLADPEIFQADIIAQFLPKQLSDEELTRELKSIIEEMGVSEMSDMGKVMGAASVKLSGKADGKTLSLKVKELLS